MVVHPQYHGKLCKCGYCNILKESKMKSDDHENKCNCRMCTMNKNMDLPEKYDDGTLGMEITK